ncbi:DUF4829 domain-containing protein [Mesobacillus subterraneus]|uniref:DUF4829 domain-containing protein n=1 Tax=Mesobacillus subterraneus TaxID=285983 RepID=A0A427TWC6_9BACI|nr:DUF4829 domain-containing protein [Mesobacillus subterraneus]RSD28636.1 DUF4829 domain-containing protein [Mesobacillus subterraneus]
MKKRILYIGLVVVIFAGLIYTQLGKAHGAEVSIGKSTKFSEEEINDAVSRVKLKFLEFNGCNLTKIWYSEDKSNELAEDYIKYGRGSETGVKAENVMVLLSNFDVDSSGGDGSFEPNSTQTDWKWILVRDHKLDRWKLDGWGY